MASVTRADSRHPEWAIDLNAAERGYIDDVIMPHATRPRIARALAMLRGKTVEMPGRKHDNLPV